MIIEKIKNKHIEEVAAYLAQHMEFSEEKIAKALTKYEMDIEEDICMDNIKNGSIKIYGDAVIFGSAESEYEGINIRTMQYLNDYECYNLINPDFLVI